MEIENRDVDKASSPFEGGKLLSFSPSPFLPFLTENINRANQKPLPLPLDVLF